jgi:predicted nucleic acid-binding protein
VKRVFIDTGAFFAHLIADDIDNSHARLASTREDEAAAIALVRAHEDKSYSLCDAIAFDRHFAEYGRFALI